jgi:aerobic-type carbon monoxide dehydrogenase small subunit (CoxS/CutS family)
VNAPPQALRFELNGRAVTVRAAPLARLSQVLREELGLTGTKVGCDAGDCGACTVLIDGRQHCACMTSLGQVAGRAVTTVEGLASEETLSPLQAAFHRHGAAQCGICTPGMLIAAQDLLSRNPCAAAPATARSSKRCSMSAAAVAPTRTPRRAGRSARAWPRSTAFPN